MLYGRKCTQNRGSGAECATWIDPLVRFFRVHMGEIDCGLGKTLDRPLRHSTGDGYSTVFAFEIFEPTDISPISVNDKISSSTVPMPSAKDPQTKWQKHAINIAGLRRDIQAIKTIARNANQHGNQTVLQHAISAPERIWTNDRAAQAFYTQLGQGQPQ
jgi:hypothetical protein